ncbi:MAG: lipoyl synthase [Candidatus Accumulibacter sp.]|jgi:lipoic acid synthetase|nr:lipoyl synthase [Accumulibacter sp.]
MSERGVKQKGERKITRWGPIPILPVRAVPEENYLRKPSWIRVKAGADAARFGEIRQLLRERKLHTVCEEAACPNIGECFGRGTAAFMILGDICTRRCPFCDVGHGAPLPPDPEEPFHLADSVARLKLRYAVITSVDRDDLRDGGARHFADVVRAVRSKSPETEIEILTPDFRGRMETALDILGEALPDVLNHNLETVPRLYRQARPGADYSHSLNLLKIFRSRYPGIPTKSGLMLGLGETDEEILASMRDLRDHGVERLTIGQYLAPSKHHLPVVRYADPEIFRMFEEKAREMGFAGIASGPMVRSSYWADKQAYDAEAHDPVPGRNGSRKHLTGSV